MGSIPLPQPLETADGYKYAQRWLDGSKRTISFLRSHKAWSILLRRPTIARAQSKWDASQIEPMNDGQQVACTSSDQTRIQRTLGLYIPSHTNLKSWGSALLIGILKTIIRLRFCVCLCVIMSHWLGISHETSLNQHSNYCCFFLFCITKSNQNITS